MMYKPSIAFARECLNFLDSIDGYLPKNLEKIAEMRRRMADLSFHSPLAFSLGSLSSKSLDGKQDKEDFAKQVKYLRQATILKKASYKRASVALAAHMIRRRIGEDPVSDHLPYNGDYLSLLFKTFPEGVIAYRNLDRLFSSGISSPVFIYVVEIGGSKVRLKARNKEELELSLERQSVPYKILSIKTGEEFLPVLRSRYVRKALFSGLVSWAYFKDKSNVFKISARKISMELLRFYALLDIPKRKINRPFPSLSLSPRIEQIEFLKVLEDGEKLMDSLTHKLSFEETVPFPSRFLFYFHLSKSLPISRISKLLSVPEEDVEKGVEIARGYDPKGKGSEFLKKVS